MKLLTVNRLKAFGEKTCYTNKGPFEYIVIQYDCDGHKLRGFECNTSQEANTKRIEWAIERENASGVKGAWREFVCEDNRKKLSHLFLEQE